MNDTFEFGAMLEHLKDGGIAHRKGWANQIVFMRPGDNIPLETVTTKVKSLPPSVRRFLEITFAGETHYADGTPIEIEFTPYLCYIDEDRCIINGWTPSNQDLQAVDWVLA